MKARIVLREEHHLGEWHWKICFYAHRNLIVTPLINNARTESEAREEAEKVAKMLGLEVVE